MADQHRASTELPGVPAGDQTLQEPRSRAYPGKTGDGVGLAVPAHPGLRQPDAAVTEGRTPMFEATDIREWRGQDVVDAEGHKIGDAGEGDPDVDTGTDLPAFATITVGLPTRHRLFFVPLDHATVGPGYVKVGFDRKQVKDAPSIDTDGELPASDEEAVFQHYGLTYQTGAGGERRLARR